MSLCYVPNLAEEGRVPYFSRKLLVLFPRWNMGNSDLILGKNSYPDGNYRLETSYLGELVEAVSLEVFGT